MNALLALGLAINELQIYAGPNQRTTTPADVLNPVPNGQKNYKGVWVLALKKQNFFTKACITTSKN